MARSLCWKGRKHALRTSDFLWMPTLESRQHGGGRGAVGEAGWAWRETWERAEGCVA